MRCYKLLLFLNLFVNVNPFMIRTTSNHNLYKLSRTSSKIFIQTPTITNNLKKVSSQSLLNDQQSIIITNKCKKDNNDFQEELKSFLIIVCQNTIKYSLMYYILFKYFFHII